MLRACRRGGGATLPLVFLTLLACTSSPPGEGTWALPRRDDPLGIVPIGGTFLVTYRDGAVFRGPPWEEILHLPPGLVLRKDGYTWFWIARDRHHLLRVRFPEVDTLLALPDTVPSTLLGMDPEGDALLVTLTSRLLLFHKGRWWTLPFRGQTAALRVKRGMLEVFWAVGGEVMGSRSGDEGRTWSSPDTLLAFPYPVLEIHPLQNALVLGWSPVLGPPLGYVFLHPDRPSRKPLLLWGGNRGLVGSRVLEADSLLVLVTTPVDTAFHPEGVRVRGVSLPSGKVRTDTLLIPGMWLYDVELQGDVLSVVAAWKDTLIRKNLKFRR